MVKDYPYSLYIKNKRKNDKMFFSNICVNLKKWMNPTVSAQLHANFANNNQYIDSAINIVFLWVKFELSYEEFAMG